MTNRKFGVWLFGIHFSYPLYTWLSPRTDLRFERAVNYGNAIEDSKGILTDHFDGCIVHCLHRIFL